jgi:hypothetical protein
MAAQTQGVFMRTQSIRKARPPGTKRKKRVMPPITLSGTVWSYGLLAEKDYAPDRALADHVPSEGDLRIWPRDQSIQLGKLGFLAASIYDGKEWRAFRLRDAIGDKTRSAYSSIQGITPLFRDLCVIVRSLAESANCTAVRGERGYFVPNRNMVIRLVVHAHDPVPEIDTEPIPPEKNALELLREGRGNKPKVDPPIALSGTVWSYLRLEGMAQDVALGGQTPKVGDIRLWPVDQPDAPHMRGVMAGSIHDGQKWRTLNLKGGVSSVEITVYLAQEEVLGLFRRIGQAIKRQVARGENRKAWFGGGSYFILSKRLFTEFQVEQEVTTVPEQILEVAPPTAPDLKVVTMAKQGSLALGPPVAVISEEPEQGSIHAPQQDASTVLETDLFGPVPPAPVYKKPKSQRKRRRRAIKPEKPPQLPGLEDDKK